MSVPLPAAPLALPGENEEEAKARIERKRKEAEEKAEAERKKAEEEERLRAEAAAAAEKEAAAKAAKADEMLDGFSARKGQDLSDWCKEQGTLLPKVEDLVYHLLTTTTDAATDKNCVWGDKDKYGKALLDMVEDDIDQQVQVLWGIQKYCHSIKFPKVDNEYLVQAMFRSMYRLDLADAEAFEQWKEDESAEHEEGKLKGIVQTTDWFNWLEEDDEDEEDEDEEYSEEEEE